MFRNASGGSLRSVVKAMTMRIMRAVEYKINTIKTKIAAGPMNTLGAAGAVKHKNVAASGPAVIQPADSAHSSFSLKEGNVDNRRGSR